PENWSVRLEEMNQKIKADETDWQRAKELDVVRSDTGSYEDKNRTSMSAAVLKYPQALLQMGFDVQKGDPVQVAELIRQSPIRFALVAHLDNWVASLPVYEDPEYEKLAARLLEITRLADPDPWSDQVRQQKSWADHGKM